MSVGVAYQRRPARMSLRAEQHSLIAAAYEKAASDTSLPPHTRAAFARKADWFRLFARVGEKRQQAALIASEAKRKAQESPADPFWFWDLLDRDDGALWGSLQRARRYTSEVISRGA
jgi:hypothetical protein